MLSRLCPGKDEDEDIETFKDADEDDSDDREEEKGSSHKQKAGKGSSESAAAVSSAAGGEAGWPKPGYYDMHKRCVMLY